MSTLNIQESTNIIYKRPKGATFLGIISLLAFIIVLVATIMLLQVEGMGVEYLALGPLLTGIPVPYAYIFSAISLLIILSGALGLILNKKFGWWIYLFYFVNYGLSYIVMFIPGIAELSMGESMTEIYGGAVPINSPIAIGLLISILFSVLFIWYFLREKVRGFYKIKSPKKISLTITASVFLLVQIIMIALRTLA